MNVKIYSSLHWFVRFLLRRICSKLVIQGYWHKEKITEYYQIMREAAEREFHEDNKVTLDAFLSECYSNAMTLAPTVNKLWVSK